MISAPQMPRSRVPAGGPLTNGQKARICILAREAWEAECRPGDYNDWRHEQQARACDQYGFAYPDYPAAICRRQYRCSIEDASERQAWNLFITVRASGQARGRRAAA